jgi:hypothetical protein
VRQAHATKGRFLSPLWTPEAQNHFLKGHFDCFWDPLRVAWGRVWCLFGGSAACTFCMVFRRVWPLLGPFWRPLCFWEAFLNTFLRCSGVFFSVAFFHFCYVCFRLGNRQHFALQYAYGEQLFETLANHCKYQLIWRLRRRFQRYKSLIFLTLLSILVKLPHHGLPRRLFCVHFESIFEVEIYVFLYSFQHGLLLTVSSFLTLL